MAEYLIDDSMSFVEGTKKVDYENLSGRVTTAENAIDVLEGRMDQFASLEEGSTTGDAELQDIRVGWDGTEYNSAGDAVRGQAQTLYNTSLSYLGTFLNSATWSTVTLDGSNTFAGLPNNIFAVCNTVETTNPITDAPVSGPMNGLIITFGRGSKNTYFNFATQIFFPQDSEKMMSRRYLNDNWSDWISSTKSVEDAIALLPQYRSGMQYKYENYHNHLYECTDDGVFFVDSGTYTENGTNKKKWTDLPSYRYNFIVKNNQYSTNFILQTATTTTAPYIIYYRVLHKTDFSNPRDWVCISDYGCMNVLAVGDSICRGTRNGDKGFVGDLGLPYVNEGVSGATLSTVRTDVTNIPTQLANYKTNHPNYTPDIIIANGGHNDYNFGAQLGAIPTEPAVNNDGTPNYNQLNPATVMGALQKLFLLMIENYPAAQRFFVTTHKIYRNATVNPEKNGYLPTKENDRGYNETQLHDAIVACCKVYNVKVIDVFEDSLINSLFEGYRGDTYYSGNSAGATADLVNYFDKDGVHPLERGYLEGYVPLIKDAIQIGTQKS